MSLANGQTALAFRPARLASQVTFLQLFYRMLQLPVINQRVIWNLLWFGQGRGFDEFCATPTDLRLSAPILARVGMTKDA